MKNLIHILVIFLCQQAYSQIVDIPDINFKNALIDQGVDSNGDGEIQLSEALKVDSLKLKNKNISSLQGIKSFINVLFLDCRINKLSSLDLDGLKKLENLSLEFNNVTSLDLQDLNNLIDLNCADNQLLSLNVQGLTNLKLLLCSQNQINSLNIKGLKNLESLYCGANQLESLDVQELPKLMHLWCHTNKLSSLYIKNGVKKSIEFSSNPNLKYICCDDFEINNIKYLAYLNGINNVAINSYCTFTLGGKFYTIKGESKLDIDKDGCDANDTGYPNLKFSISDSMQSGSIISNSTGNYSIPVQAGTHILTPIVENPTYFQINPSSKQIIFPDASDSIIQNFCFTPEGIHHDVKVSIIPLRTVRPGFDAKYKIIYKNIGTQTENGTINFLFDDNILDYISSDIQPDAQSTDLKSWNFTDLKPFESRAINIVLNLNSPVEIPPLNVGDILSYEANISILDLDEAPLDNVFDLRQTVVNSVDPNDKTCLEGNTIKPSMLGEYLHYLIRFENTGTYAAENVVVKDVIDTSVFDVQSLQITDASHKMFTRINGNVVEFIFEDIQLPFDDANNDGYVAFEIKTRPNLKIGDALKNIAEIYFDYNLPIITNEAQTFINNAVFTSETKDTAIDFYPNPIKDIAHFVVNDQIEKAQIYDLNGKILRSTSLSNNELNIQELKNGTYMVRLFTKNNVYIAKLVKMCD